MDSTTISLGEFERRHGVNRGSVSRAGKDLGIDTSAGLNPQDYERMKDHFNVTEAPRTELHTTEVMRPGSLIPAAPRALDRVSGRFDAQAYQLQKAQLEQSAQANSLGLHEFAAQYAQNRMAQALADIDLVADSIRAQALASMGKPQPADDGNAA